METNNTSTWGQVAQSILFSTIIYLRIAVDKLMEFIFGVIYMFTDVKKLPPVDNPILLKSASAIAKMIRDQEITSEEVVTLFINRIKQVNPTLNAMVCERFEKAILEAKQVDKMIASNSYTKEQLEREKPLLGLPFTSKESTANEGLNWTCGLLSRSPVISQFDANIVKGVKKAGAILIGATNVPELNLWFETRNLVYGQTNNPYNTNKTVGGSSGGEAAIMASCGSALGLGTDIGGSCRIPAYYCGVYGHKLTAGIINTHGMTFRTGNEHHTIVTAGPITKFACDLKPLAQTVVLPDMLPLLNLDLKVDGRQLKYFYVLEPGDLRVSPMPENTINLMLNLVSSITESTASSNVPKQVSFNGFKYSYALWRYWMSKEPGEFARGVKDNRETADIWVELGRLLTGKCEHTLPILLKLADLKMPLPSAEWAEKETKDLLDGLLKTLGDDGVLLFPSHPGSAPYHYLPFTRPFNFAYWAIFNALKLPSTQIPLGLDNEGLPIGIQVVAGPYQDRLCFAAAEYVESLMGGWVPPFPLGSL